MKRIEDILGALFATNDFTMVLEKRRIQVYTTLYLNRNRDGQEALQIPSTLFSFQENRMRDKF